MDTLTSYNDSKIQELRAGDTKNQRRICTSCHQTMPGEDHPDFPYCSDCGAKNVIEVFTTDEAPSEPLISDEFVLVTPDEFVLEFSVFLVFVVGIPFSLGYIFWAQFKNSEWHELFPWAVKVVGDLPLASVLSGGITFVVGCAIFMAVVRSVDEPGNERVRKATAWALFGLLASVILTIATPFVFIGLHAIFG